MTKPKRKYTSSDLEQATTEFAENNTQSVQGFINNRKLQYRGIPCQTLDDHLKGKNGKKRGRQRSLNKAEDARLCVKMTRLTEMHDVVNTSMLVREALIVARTPRHPDEDINVIAARVELTGGKGWTRQWKKEHPQ